ncbi:hypothetical protein JQ604_32730 [Bradyrhizobium jicamae]|uniref:hypothetical protein n=1 Tax=Bradyrhizobium jicamae TaxID=280332 RepID=UPI001BA8D2FB|nr:hypothetical protein [Bradyrhizobium jicamae]MBR0756972.1 hypothetical protein [Bradyrhizobium jicamae]
MRDYTFEQSLRTGKDRSRNWLVKECISEHPNDEAAAHESLKAESERGHWTISERFARREKTPSYIAERTMRQKAGT